jgi:heptosyltransferase-3
LRIPAERLDPQLEPRRILVICVARIGDTLLTTPALRALAARWPGAAITFLGHPKRVEVMQHLPFLAAVGPISKHRAAWRGWLSRRHFDLALVYGFDRALVSYALRVARDVVAFRQGSRARRTAPTLRRAPAFPRRSRGADACRSPARSTCPMRAWAFPMR